MLLTVFRRGSSIDLFEYRTEIPLVGKSGFLRNFHNTKLLISQQLHHAGHPELIDIIADTDVRQGFQFII